MPEQNALTDENRDGIVISGETQTLPDYIKGTPPRIEELRKALRRGREAGARPAAQTQDAA